MSATTRKLQAVIFPHASISAENLKKVLSLFEKATIFQPWFMEEAPFSAGDSPRRVEVLNPPERLKPGEHFKTLLAEYRRWVQDNRGTGLQAFLAFARERSQNPPVYEIRGMLRTMGKSAEEDQAAEALQCHLTLHLAEELEEEQKSAQALLNAAARIDSPLKGAIEGEDAPGLLGGAAGLERENFFTEERLARILDAWFFLFGEKVPDRVPLITTEPQVMQFLKETWEEFVYPEGLGEAPGEAAGSLEWTFLHLPPIPKEKLPGKRRFMRGLSGRTIGLVQDGAPGGG